MAVVTAAPPSAFPPGVDGEAILRPFFDETGRWHPAWDPATRRPQDYAHYRRMVCARSPLHFAIGYLTPYVQHGGALSFSAMHLGMLGIIASWAQPGPHRDAVVGAREGGKTTLRIIGTTWALAYGYRSFYLTFSRTARQARLHLGNVLDLFKCSGANGARCGPLLLKDFPHLEVVGGSGGMYQLRSGARLMAAGLDESTLGTLAGGGRPDLIGIDDVTPGAKKITAEHVEAAKAGLTADVLPMGGDAALLYTGTVFLPGDLADDVVRVATGQGARGKDAGAWLTGNGIRAHYWPADWPAKWPLALLAAEWADNPGQYALAKAPHLLDHPDVVKSRRTYFTPTLWQSVPQLVDRAQRRVISVDPAVTTGRKSDETGLAVVSGTHLDPNVPAGRAVVEHAEQGQWVLDEIRDAIWRAWGMYADGARPSVVLWEAVQGGEALAQQVRPLPPGVELVTYTVRSPKSDSTGTHGRLIRLLDDHRRGAVVLGREVPAYRAQAEAWTPRATADHILDAVAGAVRWLLSGKAEM